MRWKRWSHDEDGTTVIGEVLAVAITVSIVGVAGAAALDSLEDVPGITTTQLRATLDCGSGAWYDGDERIVIYHRGGPDLSSGELRLQLNINGRLHDDPLGGRLAGSAALGGGGVHGSPTVDDLDARAALLAAYEAALADAHAAAEAAAAAAAAAEGASEPQGPEAPGGGQNAPPADPAVIVNAVAKAEFADSATAAAVAAAGSGDGPTARASAQAALDAMQEVDYASHSEFKDGKKWLNHAVSDQHDIANPLLDAAKAAHAALGTDPTVAELQAMADELGVANVAITQFAEVMHAQIPGASHVPDIAAINAAVAAAAQAEMDASAAWVAAGLLDAVAVGAAASSANANVQFVGATALAEYKPAGVWLENTVGNHYGQFEPPADDLAAADAAYPGATATIVEMNDLATKATMAGIKAWALANSMVPAPGQQPGGEPGGAAAAAAATAAEAAAEAQAAAEAAGDALEAAGHHELPAFDVGSAWVSEEMTLTHDSYISYTILSQTANAVVADGLVTERICGGQTTVIGVFQEVFGVLPYIDRDCDGVRAEGDELLERSDFDDGYFRIFGATGCLAIPEGVEPIVADSIYLEAPEGVSVAVDLTSTSGPIQLVSGGPIVVPDIKIDSAEGVQIDGGSVDARGTEIKAPEGSFKIQAHGGPIDARGMDAEVGQPGATDEPEPIIDLPDQAGVGSIRMCAALLDATNRVTNGWQWSDRTFTFGGRPGVEGMPAEGILPDVVVEAPIPLNADLFYDDGIKDSHCVTYNDLELGGWFYERGVVDDDSDWEISLHNDQNTDAIVTVDSFFHYSPELFDNDPGNDGERDTNADGHIMLTDSRPFRSVVALFRSTETLVADVAIDSDGGDIDVSDAQFLAHAADVSVVSDGGSITAHRFNGTAAGDLSQVRLTSSGGAIAATDMVALAPGGHVLLLANTGAVDLAGTHATAMYGVDISGGPHIDLSTTSLIASQDQVDVTVNGLLVQVNQQGAHVSDRDGIGSILAAPAAPTSTAVLEGIAASGGFAIL